MLNETVEKRLTKDRAQTSITLRIPVDVVESLKMIATRNGYSGYQTLLKAYISDTAGKSCAELRCRCAAVIRQ